MRIGFCGDVNEGRQLKMLPGIIPDYIIIRIREIKIEINREEREKERGRGGRLANSRAGHPEIFIKAPVDKNALV